MMMVIRIIIMNMVTMRGILYDDDGDDKPGAIIQILLTFVGNRQVVEKLWKAVDSSCRTSAEQQVTFYFLFFSLLQILVG